MKINEQVGGEDKFFVFDGLDDEPATLEEISIRAMQRAGRVLADQDIRISYDGCGTHNILVEWGPVEG